MGRYFLILMALRGFFSAMAHRVPKPASSTRGFDHYALQYGGASERQDAEVSEPGDGSNVVLERSGDGHFYADVEINGTPVHMLVDTGASGVALSRDDARSAGIATSIGMKP